MIADCFVEVHVAHMVAAFFSVQAGKFHLTDGNCKAGGTASMPKLCRPAF